MGDLTTAVVDAFAQAARLIGDHKLQIRILLQYGLPGLAFPIFSRLRDRRQQRPRIDHAQDWLPVAEQFVERRLAHSLPQFGSLQDSQRGLARLPQLGIDPSDRDSALRAEGCLQAAHDLVLGYWAER